MNFHLLLIFGCSWVLPLVQNEDRIIGGSDAKRHQFPFMISLQHNELHQCGGSVISKGWVITAAHCFRNETKTDWLVVAGMLNQNETHPDIQRVPVCEIFVHPDFVIQDTGVYNIENDIAMVQLSWNLQFTEAVKPISLPKPKQDFSGTVWISGWGSFTLPETKPRTLQCLEMNIISNEECKDLRTKLSVIPTFKIRDSMVCTVPFETNDRSSACHSDSGGPLSQNGVLIGIVSFGDQKCGPYVTIITNVFTRVSSYIDFIKSYVNDF